MHIEELRINRKELHDRLEALNDRARRERRNLTDAEQRDYDSAEQDFGRMSDELAKLERGSRPHITPAAIHGNGASVRQGGHQITLEPEQRMATWAADQPDRSSFSVPDADEFCLGNVMRAMVEPAYRSELTDVEQRALAEGTDASGGFITPVPLSVNIIDRIRNNMKVIEAGATTVPLNSDKQTVPRLSGGVTGAWRTENSAFAETQPVFEAVTFTPRSYGFIVRTSEELYQDMIPGGGAILELEFTQAAALELDRAALRGSGAAPEPQGVRNQSGVTIQSLGTNGATPTYANLMTAVTTLLTANRQPNGVILAPRTSQTYGGLTDTTNQPLNPPRPIADLPFYVTGQLPVNLVQGTSSDTSEAYVGYWPDLLLGVRLGVELRLLTERYADTGQYAWRVHMRLDVQVAHPESFVVLTGVRP